MVLKEGGGPLCSLDCDPSCKSLSLKVSAQGTNEPLCRERSNQCCPGVMAVPGFSPLLCIHCYDFTIVDSKIISIEVITMYILGMEQYEHYFDTPSANSLILFWVVVENP